ncbi:MAG: hypothetical protein AAF551_11535, partial [Bacteroidota bacterium]
MQRFIGDISTLDRGKYMTAHFLITGSDAEFTAFKSTYNIADSYLGSRQFWNPFGRVKDGVIPNVGSKFTGVRDVTPWLVATGTAGALFHDDNADYSVEDVSQFSKDAAEYVAESYKNDWDRVPQFIEPF